MSCKHHEEVSADTPTNNEVNSKKNNDIFTKELATENYYRRMTDAKVGFTQNVDSAWEQVSSYLKSNYNPHDKRVDFGIVSIFPNGKKISRDIRHEDCKNLGSLIVAKLRKAGFNKAVYDNYRTNILDNGDCRLSIYLN